MGKIAQKNVDINLQATEGKDTKQALNDIINKLKKVQELSQFDLGIDSNKIKEAERGIKRLQEANDKNLKSKERESKLLKTTLLSQKAMLGIMKEQASSTSGYSKITKEIEKYQQSVKNGIPLTRKQINDLQELEKTKRKNVTTTHDLASAYAALQVFRRLSRMYTQQAKTLRDIDQSMYNLGVVAGKTTNEIEKMKLEFLDLATKSTQSAIELADATDILARSGLEFESAFETMMAGAKLATASGESVADVSRIKNINVLVKFRDMLENRKVA